MKIRGDWSLSTTGKRLAGTLIAVVLGMAFSGDAIAALQHNYLFNSGNGTQILDSQGTAHGTAIGGTFTTADSRFAMDGVDDYGDLPGAAIAINAYSQLTFEMWASVSTVHEGQYTASAAFGTTLGDGSGGQYIMMQPTRGGAEGSSGQITATSGGGEARVTATQDLSDGRIHHTVTTINATELAYYVDGVQIGTIDLMGTTISQVSNDFAYLGRSVWNFDPVLNGAIYEFRIYNDAKSATDVANLFAAGCLDACGEMYLEINRDTGATTLFTNLSPKSVVITEIASAKGALNPSGWLSITENYDQDSGGPTPRDPDDTWQITSQTKTLLSEEDTIFSGADDGLQFASSIALGNIWTRSPFEDFEVNLTILDANFEEQDLSVPVRFVGTMFPEPFSRSDFDVDGDVDEDDYLTLRANHLATLGGTLHIDTFHLGDVNGDLANDYRDFRSFKADFIAANGAGAWAGLIAGHGAVPEPGTLGLLMLGVAAGVLTARRKRGEEGVRNTFAVFHHCSESPGIMTCISKVFFLFAFSLMIPSVSHAQSVVITETFDTRTDLTGIGVSDGGATPALVNQGPGDNALQWTATSVGGGFFVAGFTISDLEIEPGPGGPNISPILADYQLSFDLTINAIDGYLPNLEIWLADGPRFGANNANLYAAGGLVNGVNNISFPLNQNLITTTPNGFTNPGGMWSPTADDWWIQVNTISFAAPPGASFDYTIDNIQVTIDIATSLALVVDPTSGKARIRNVSGADVAMDYYRIESANGSLLTANFNGTTGWNSLDDQGLGAIGSGFGESWDEVVEANSASQLVEQFLLGETTLGPGQSVPLGAPINPTILNNNLGSLSFRFGGPDFPFEGIGQVMFADLSALAGDYNENGVVDAADYVLWRNNPAAFGGAGGYNTWRANFGASLGAGAVSRAVPEPTAGLLCGLAICVAAGVRVRRTVRAQRTRGNL